MLYTPHAIHKMASSSEPIPLVVVEGFLSGAGTLAWGNFETHSKYACRSNGEKERRTIFAKYVELRLLLGTSRG